MAKNRRRTAFEARRKSQVVAYLLWLLLGIMGAHRFYLGMKFSGSVMWCLACIGSVTLLLSGTRDEALLRASVVVVPLVGWMLSDVFRIPGFVRDCNDRLIRWLSGDVETRYRQRTRTGRGRYPKTVKDGRQRNPGI